MEHTILFPFRYNVGGICGETVGDIPEEMLIQQNDIIVLTPQILVNWLQYGNISSLAVFTLLIFDECHNTTGNHPYNVLMSSYLDLKFGSSASPRPQVRHSMGVLGKKFPRLIRLVCSFVAVIFHLAPLLSPTVPFALSLQLEILSLLISRHITFLSSAFLVHSRVLIQQHEN